MGEGEEHNEMSSFIGKINAFDSSTDNLLLYKDRLEHFWMQMKWLLEKESHMLLTL